MKLKHETDFDQIDWSIVLKTIGKGFVIIGLIAALYLIIH